MTATVILHEHSGEAGELVHTRLACDDDGQLTLIVGQERRPLPDGAVDAVMKRFGKPLEAADGPALEETLHLGEGRTLGRFRFLRRYDVIARDYLLFCAPGEEPLCEMATAVTAALEHLARSLAARTQP